MKGEAVSDPSGCGVLRDEAPASRRTRIDREYDNSAVFTDVPRWREKWRERSDAVSRRPADRLDLAYGPRPLQKIDIFPCGSASARTAMFIHGGFWTRNSKETFRFLLSGIHAAGCNAAFLGYTLAPNARMDEIVEDARLGGRWLFSKLGEFGLASRPFVAIGWSAGAQLAAMIMDEPHVACGMGVSGVYDLRPMREASLNDALRLSDEEAARNSPRLNPVRSSKQFTVVYGARELPAFKAQSEDFYAALISVGSDAKKIVLPDHTHHSELDELFEADGRLVKETARLAWDPKVPVAITRLTDA
jgi:arylformamidase